MKLSKKILSILAASILVLGSNSITGCILVLGNDTEQNGGNTGNDNDAGNQTGGNTGGGSEAGGEAGGNAGSGSEAGGQTGGNAGDPSDDDVTDISSVEYAKALVIGWNLGNTLDADTETYWGAPKTTKAMIDAVAAAGFKTIRIPVSWSKHVSGSEYEIDSSWMARVKEVVNYAVDNDMYIILNVHHDNYYAGKEYENGGQKVKGLDNSDVSGYAIAPDSQVLQTKSKNYLRSVWTQIANEFATYNDKLIFEVLNEPRAVGTSYEWGFNGNDLNNLPAYTNVITDYEEVCIAAIRAVSGNENRFLMVPGYAASGADPNLLKNYNLPSDTATDKLILSTHAYSPYNFAMANSDSVFGDDDKSSLDAIFSYLKTAYTDKGIGVVMGEASASNKANDVERIKWVEYYFGKAKAAGIPVVLWDNMVFDADGHEGPAGNAFNGEHHGWLDRQSGTWYFPSIIEAMMNTVGVTGYSIPLYVKPTPEGLGWKGTATKSIVTKPGVLAWGTDSNILAKSNFANAKEGSILKIVFKASGANFKIINSSWTTYGAGKILNGTIEGDSKNVITSNSTELYYVLSASDAAAFKSNDIYLAGQNGTVTAVYFQE